MERHYNLCLDSSDSSVWVCKQSNRNNKIKTHDFSTLHASLTRNL